jgi:hypothetical protein
MNNPESPQDAAKREGATPADSRRDFLKRMAAAGGLAGLGHFVVLGGARKAAADVLPDCSQVNPDLDCQIIDTDACFLTNPDTCSADGRFIDSCVESPDGCTSGKPEDDICNVYSPDVCNPSVSGSDSCDPGFPN